MAFSIIYKPLFHVNILHHYYLNDGDTEYATMSESKKQKQLINYDISNFFSVLPSAKISQILKGHNMVFKTSNAGLMVWVKVSADSVPFIITEDSLELTFLLKVNYNTFFNFTNIEFDNVNELFYFSNKRLITEPGNFPMIKKTGGNTLVGDNYALTIEIATSELNLLSRNEKENLFGIIEVHMKGYVSGLNVTHMRKKCRSRATVEPVIGHVNMIAE